MTRMNTHTPQLEQFIEHAGVQRPVSGLVIATALVEHEIYADRPDKIIECGVAATAELVVFAGIMNKQKASVLTGLKKEAERVYITGPFELANTLQSACDSLIDDRIHDVDRYNRINASLNTLFLAGITKRLDLSQERNFAEIRPALLRYHLAFQRSRKDWISQKFAKQILQTEMDKRVKS